MRGASANGACLAWGRSTGGIGDPVARLGWHVGHDLLATQVLGDVISHTDGQSSAFEIRTSKVKWSNAGARETHFKQQTGDMRGSTADKYIFGRELKDVAHVGI